jgi:hypothetical protein
MSPKGQWLLRPSRLTRFRHPGVQTDGRRPSEPRGGSGGLDLARLAVAAPVALSLFARDLDLDVPLLLEAA